MCHLFDSRAFICAQPFSTHTMIFSLWCRCWRALRVPRTLDNVSLFGDNIPEMETRSRQLEKYLTVDGRCPFDEWKQSIKDKKSRAIVDARLLRLMQGNLGDYKAVGDGVKELRIDWGPGLRVYFGEDGRTLVILLCGGDKKSQVKDIESAKAFWEEYRS